MARTCSNTPNSLKLSNTWLQACICLFVVPAVFTVIALVVQSTLTAKWTSDHDLSLSSIQKLDASTIIAILRVSQAVLSTLTSFALDDSFQVVQWALISRPKGLSYASVAALSPTTGALGMIRIVVSSTAGGSSKVWTLLKGNIMLILWLSTLVLFFRTSTTTVYDTAMTYNVTAGVGPFNGSYVQPFLDYLTTLSPPEYPYQILPYTYFAPAYNLVITSLYSNGVPPVRCSGSDDCFSYLLSGGLELATPWAPLNLSNYPLVKIKSVPTIQLEFTRLRTESFVDSDCQILGDPNGSIGVRLCIAQASDNSGELNAGIFSCLNGTKDGICHTTTPAPNISTVATVFTRFADIVVARSNYSIVGVSNLSDPVQLRSIDTGAYRIALAWLLNFTASGIPAPSSIVSNFYIADQQLQNPQTYGILLQNFQSIIAFPFWMFNANNYGNLDLKPQDIINTLPSEFYTKACIVAPYSTILFNDSMFHLFLALQSAVILFLWIVLLWTWIGVKHKFPIVSSFPLLDAVLKGVFETKGDKTKILSADSSDILDMVGSHRAKMRTREA
ncbi:hypothetical protein F5Y10DRAFT_271913 [Nemania abortiva]|nr:hypothetical protein F5Y10DRAFT_271913 [Nemania abortiva]